MRWCKGDGQARLLHPTARKQAEAPPTRGDPGIHVCWTAKEAQSGWLCGGVHVWNGADQQALVHGPSERWWRTTRPGCFGGPGESAPEAALESGGICPFSPVGPCYCVRNRLPPDRPKVRGAPLPAPSQHSGAIMTSRIQAPTQIGHRSGAKGRKTVFVDTVGRTSSLRGSSSSSSVLSP